MANACRILQRAGFAAGALAIAMAVAAQATALTPRDVWIDPETGYAIGGYDPVSYFVSHAPRPGQAGIEFADGSVTWMFASTANRAAFAHAPDVYTPRFGGRDPMQLARGFEARGNPHHWLIEGGDLFLFASPQTRLDWIAASADVRAAAERNWPDVVEATY